MYTGKQMFVKPMTISSLEIDLPVSEANVLQKIESIKSVGMVQPVTVWLGSKDNNFTPRIIDGFHRVVAAQRIGWTEVMCNQIDCSEEAFWDARIQSAKQHHEIENDRLTSWILECWKHSEFGNDDKNPIYNMPKLWWEDNRLVGDNKPVANWMKDHANKWGCGIGYLWELLIKSTGIGTKYKTDDIADDVSDKLRLDFEQTRLVHYAADHTRMRNNYGGIQYLEKCLSDYMTPEKRLDVEYTTHEKLWLSNRDNIKSIDDLEQKQKDDWREKEHNKYVQDEIEKRTPGTQAYIRQQAVKKRDARKVVMDLYSRLYEFIGANKDYLKTLNDGPDMMAEFAIFAKKTIDELWPSYRQDVWEVPKVLLENRRLRKELKKEHDLRVMAEAQFLDGKARADKLREQLENAIAWPSID